MDVKYETEKCMYKGFNIQDHPKRQHREKKYHCNSCNYKASKLTDLTCHVVNKHPVSPVKRQGESRMECLSIKLYSDNGVPYKCKKCSYAATRKDDLNKRVKVQADSGGLRLGWVDLDLQCSTILLGQ